MPGIPPALAERCTLDSVLGVRFGPFEDNLDDFQEDADDGASRTYARYRGEDFLDALRNRKRHRPLQYAWKPYQGPHGGRGWQDDATGKVAYQDNMPGEGGHSEQGKPDWGQSDLQAITDKWDKQAKEIGIDSKVLHDASVQSLHNNIDIVGRNINWLGQKYWQDVLVNAYKQNFNKLRTNKESEERTAHFKPATAKASAAHLTNALVSWFKGEDDSDWSLFSDADRDRMAQTLAKQPARILQAIGSLGDLSVPAEQAERDVEEEQIPSYRAIRNVIGRALVAIPQPEKQPLDASNCEKAWVVDLSSEYLGPDGKQAWDLIARAMPTTNALTGKKVRIVFKPKGIRDDDFGDMVNEVLGGNGSAWNIGNEPEAYDALWVASIAPEQVAVHQAPKAARGLDQSDAETFHADNVDTYKRVSKSLWIKKNAGGGDDYELVGSDEIPELTAIPKSLLNRDKENTGDVVEERSVEEVLAAIRERKETKKVAEAERQEAKSQRAGESKETEADQWRESAQGKFDDADSAVSDALDITWDDDIPEDEQDRYNETIAGLLGTWHDAVQAFDPDDVKGSLKAVTTFTSEAISKIKSNPASPVNSVIRHAIVAARPIQRRLEAKLEGKKRPRKIKPSASPTSPTQHAKLAAALRHFRDQGRDDVADALVEAYARQSKETNDAT